MPNMGLALIHFGKLVGLLDNQNPQSGTVLWSWFANPLGNSAQSIRDNRELLGAFIRALLDRDPAEANKQFDPVRGLEWEFVGSDQIGVGFVWNSNLVDPLHLGLGVNGTLDIGTPKLALSLLASLLRIDGGSFSGEFGQISLGATFPVPQSFLKSGALLANYVAGQLDLKLTVQNNAGESKSLSLPPPTFLPWDAARMAAFVVHSWVHQKLIDNPGDKGFFYRIDSHLFPMLGAPPLGGPIQPITPLDETGRPPNFTDWESSVFTTSGGAKGAVMFLWHLKALITGIDKPDLFSGSSYFPLVMDPGAPATYPPADFPIAGTYPPSPDAAGVWVGVRPGPSPGDTDLVMEFRSGNPATVASFAMVRSNNGSMERPSIATADLNAVKTLVATLAPSMKYGDDNAIVGEDTAAGYKVTVFTAKGVADAAAPQVNGDYSFSFILNDGQPMQYAFESPVLGMAMPPTNAATANGELVEHLLEWMFYSALSSPGPLTDAVKALLDFVKQAITSASPPSLDALLGTMAALAPDGKSTEFDLGNGNPFSLYLDPAKNANGALGLEFAFGPLSPGASSPKISVGTIELKTDFSLATSANPIADVSMSLRDIRIGKQGLPDGAGLVAQLFPDLMGIAGFAVNVAWSSSSALPSVTGGGKIPIQRSIGPLEILALLVEIDNNSVSVGVDLNFALGPITASVYELGVRYVFKDPSGSGSDQKTSLFLHGIGVAFDQGGIKLEGLFLEVPQPSGDSDYVGGAVVSIEDLFQLSAIGGYTVTEGKDSLFIFAALVAPLGGPPWFFITGIAGGFGYNRSLPPVTLLGDHPFLRVLRGDITPDFSNAQQALVDLSALFKPQVGQYWIAAGIQFTCFGVINGKLIVAVSFGNKFSFNVLGSLSYGISHIVYFELDFGMTADEEHFLLIAGISPNSYILSSDIFSLQGKFAMGAWYSKGDFVLSVGGYHPSFNRPAHYPDLTRLGCKAMVAGFVHMDVQAFFACTPQALMAGASLSLWAGFEGISAGLDFYADVLMHWDPFYLDAAGGVAVWFEFLGRHEVSVDFRLWTPDFGGKASIDVAVVSFDIGFGGDPHGDTGDLSLDHVLTKQIGVPASPAPYGGAVVNTFNVAPSGGDSDPVAGLIRFDVTAGRTTAPPANVKTQEGIGAPIPVNSEFKFVVRTRLPIPEPGADKVISSGQLNGTTKLALCQPHEAAGSLAVTGLGIDKPGPGGNAGQTRVINYFPAAIFGDRLPSGVSAHDALANIDTSNPSIPMSEGIEFDYTAKEIPAGYPDLASPNFEYSQGDEQYPLPLAWPGDGPQSFKVPITPVRFASAPLKTKIAENAPYLSAQDAATAANSKLAAPPLTAKVRMANVLQAGIDVIPRSLSLAHPPDTATVVAVPISPVRRVELLPVTLRLASMRANTPAPRATLSRVKRVGKVEQIPVATDSTGTPSTSSFTLLPGRVVSIDLAGGALSKVQRIVTAGQGTNLRMIAMGPGEMVLDDKYVPAGSAAVTPSGTTSLALFHHGTLTPTGNVPGILPIPGITEHIGIQADTIAIALGTRSFSAYGCVVRSSRPLSFSPSLFDAVPGSILLKALTRFTLFLPAVQQGSTLVFTVEPNAANPGPARDQIRWAVTNARVQAPATLVDIRGSAFLMTVETRSRWQLELDLGPDWRVSSVVISPVALDDLFKQLAASNHWSLLDGRIQTGREVTPISVNLEVNP